VGGSSAENSSQSQVLQVPSLDMLSHYEQNPLQKPAGNKGEKDKSTSHEKRKKQHGPVWNK
jgi:hypothetical protein